jgi:hypothetical protein
MFPDNLRMPFYPSIVASPRDLGPSISPSVTFVGPIPRNRQEAHLAKRTVGLSLRNPVALARDNRRPAFLTRRSWHRRFARPHRPGLRIAACSARSGSRRIYRAGRCPATVAGEPMPLVFSNDRLDFREFPDLVPQRLGITSCQPFAATATGAGLERDRFLDALRRDEGVLKLLVPRLPAPFSLRFRLRGRRLGVRLISPFRRKRNGLGRRLCPRDRTHYSHRYKVERTFSWLKQLRRLLADARRLRRFSLAAPGE